ncbi:MAG: hypothetical protein AAGM22_02550 [Acidobacteriota bacterium]
MASARKLAWLGAVGLALAPLRRVAIHDVRSPLNALRLNLTLVRRTLERGGAQRWLEVAEEEVVRTEACFAAAATLLGAGGADGEAVDDLTSSYAAASSLLSSLAEKRGVDWRPDVEAPRGRWSAESATALLATAAVAIEACASKGVVVFECCGAAERARVRIRRPGPENGDGAERLAASLEPLWRCDDRLGSVSIEAPDDGVAGRWITVDVGGLAPLVAPEAQL